MSISRRYLGGLPIAAGLTVGLAVTLMLMIKTDGLIEDTRSGVEIAAINPVEAIIDPPPRSAPPTLLKVTIPPAPPVVDTLPSSLPTENPVGTYTNIPPLVLPKSTLGPIVMTIAYREKAAINKIAPIMPNRAERSGHCKMRFDISAQGSPFNVRAASCSQALFERASIKAVQKWKYMPEIINGNAVAVQGLSDTIRYNLLDAHGELIAE